ncbi:YqgE/AlgH family protein [Aestuariibaculum suncheonense]|uniref:YqgE/AlgH family protein n=1 Tax=Aestuariibaculum suncheonense TaxID=1028745 RepID=A0A8J6UB84_9FLAO|nr:YqgE/AlgH family protein [Aestuariibaculum suncheonense]MBD0835217.1 YqgE/AlgH family protein [Aestuariibaculum suncheonense]
MITIQPKKGNLLIAEPAIIGDVSFNRSIVLLAEHSHEGSVGFILNKPLDYNINDLVPEVEANFKVYNGGPVEQDNLYFIHRIPDLIPDSVEISLGIYWGGDFSKVAELIAENNIKEDEIRFFLGYSGWGANQLDDELKSNSWVVTENIYKNEIIGKDYESFWKEKMLEFGDEYSIWSNAPENPNYN